MAAFFLTKGKRFLYERLLGCDGPTPERGIPAFLRHLGEGGDPKRLEAIAAEVHALAPDALERSEGAAATALLGHGDEVGLAGRARELHETEGATIVAFGHTHEAWDGNEVPPFGAGVPRRAFNTGSWMPRMVIGEDERPHWSDLRPRECHYDLRYLVVELSDTPRARLQRIRP